MEGKENLFADTNNSTNIFNFDCQPEYGSFYDMLMNGLSTEEPSDTAQYHGVTPQIVVDHQNVGSSVEVAHDQFNTGSGYSEPNAHPQQQDCNLIFQSHQTQVGIGNMGSRDSQHFEPNGYLQRQVLGSFGDQGVINPNFQSHQTQSGIGNDNDEPNGHCQQQVLGTFGEQGVVNPNFQSYQTQSGIGNDNDEPNGHLQQQVLGSFGDHGVVNPNFQSHQNQSGIGNDNTNASTALGNDLASQILHHSYVFNQGILRNDYWETNEVHNPTNPDNAATNFMDLLLGDGPSPAPQTLVNNDNAYLSEMMENPRHDFRAFSVYDPRYEGLGFDIDPHLRMFKLHIESSKKRKISEAGFDDNY